jgi:hypothetical protein
MFERWCQSHNGQADVRPMRTDSGIEEVQVCEMDRIVVYRGPDDIGVVTL